MGLWFWFGFGGLQRGCLRCWLYAAGGVLVTVLWWALRMVACLTSLVVVLVACGCVLVD